MLKKCVVLIMLLFPGCAGIPDGVAPVTGFEISRYLGKWYEIARLDHSFERGLENVSAVYSLNDDGSVKVINRGYDSKAEKWKQAEGKAYFVEATDVGRLKVSFFGPFYGGYNIIELDHKEYSYSMVCGPDRSYLWILSRTPKMETPVLSDLVSRAKDLGFDTESLIYVKQELVPE